MEKDRNCRRRFCFCIAAAARGGGTSNNPTDPDCYVAVMEGRGAAKGEVGVAAISLASPLLVLCQFSDSATYPLTLTKLMALNPCHVVYPASNLDPIMGASTGVKLYDDISNKLSNTNLTPVHRRYFNEAKGLLTVKQVMVKEGSWRWWLAQAR